MVKKGYVRGQRGNEELQAGQGSNTINFPTCDLVSHESAGFPTSAAATIAAAPLLDTFTLLYSIVGIFVGEVVLCVWPLCGSMSTSVPTSCYPPPPTLFPSHARYSTVQYSTLLIDSYDTLTYFIFWTKLFFRTSARLSSITDETERHRRTLFAVIGETETVPYYLPPPPPPPPGILPEKYSNHGARVREEDPGRLRGERVLRARSTTRPRKMDLCFFLNQQYLLQPIKLFEGVVHRGKHVR